MILTPFPASWSWRWWSCLNVGLFTEDDRWGGEHARGRGEKRLGEWDRGLKKKRRNSEFIQERQKEEIEHGYEKNKLR